MRNERDPHKHADADRVLAALARLSATEILGDAAAVGSQTEHAVRRAEKAVAHADSLVADRHPSDRRPRRD